MVEGRGRWERGGGVRRKKGGGLGRRESAIEKSGEKSFVHRFSLRFSLQFGFALPISPLRAVCLRVARVHTNAKSENSLFSFQRRRRFPSVRRLFARPGRLVKCDVEEEKSRSPGQPRGRGPHGAREHRVRAPGVELLVVDHREERTKRERRERRNRFFFPSLRSECPPSLFFPSSEPKGTKKSI